MKVQTEDFRGHTMKCTRKRVGDVDLLYLYLLLTFRYLLDSVMYLSRSQVLTVELCPRERRRLDVPTSVLILYS